MTPKKISPNGEQAPLHPGSDNVLGIRRRDQFIRAAVTGVIVGAVAVLFQLALNLADITRFSFLNDLKLHPDWGWAVLPIIGGIAAGIGGYLVERYSPEASGSGIPHAKAVLLGIQEIH